MKCKLVKHHIAFYVLGTDTIYYYTVCNIGYSIKHGHIPISVPPYIPEEQHDYYIKKSFKPLKIDFFDVVHIYVNKFLGLFFKCFRD